MVAVKEFSWEEVSFPDFGARAAWPQAVAEVAAKAHEKLPECNGRVDKAVEIVLAGDSDTSTRASLLYSSQQEIVLSALLRRGHSVFLTEDDPGASSLYVYAEMGFDHGIGHPNSLCAGQKHLSTGGERYSST